MKNTPLYRDKHKGERLFILCTGPSIAFEDLAPLKDEWTWGAGAVFKWDGLPFIPQYYGCGESGAFFKYGSTLEKLPTTRFVVSLNSLEKIGLTCDHDYWRELRLGPGHIHEGVVYGLEEEELTCVAAEISCSALLASVQPALWLGFDPIYLLGFDLSETYVDGGKRDPGANPSPNNPEGRVGTNEFIHTQQINALGKLKENLDRAGKRLVNLSQETTEDVLDKDTLVNVLAHGSNRSSDTS